MQTHKQPTKQYCTWCHTTESLDWEVLKRLLQELEITIHEKNLVLARFHQIYNHIDKHYTHIQRSYNYSKLFIITASVINPALLSIMPSANGDIYLSLFWLVWTLQIIVSLVTAYITLFKWDKKLFMYMMYKQRVEQEIWMFLELTGQYSIVQPLNEAEVSLMHTTHQTKIKHFLLQLEKLYKKLQESDFNIENTENEKDTEQRVKIDKDDKSILRQKIMSHKIDTVLEAIHSASSEEQRKELQETLQRLQKLKEQNYMVDTQLENKQTFRDIPSENSQ